MAFQNLVHLTNVVLTWSVYGMIFQNLVQNDSHKLFLWSELLRPFNIVHYVIKYLWNMCKKKYVGKINHKNDFFFAIMNVKNHYLDSFVWIISNTDDQSLSTRHLSFWTKFWKIIPYTDHVNTTFVKWTKFWKAIPYTDNVDTTFVKWTKFWKAIPYTDHVNTTFVKYSGTDRPYLI
jgi:hypothetical protein